VRESAQQVFPGGASERILAAIELLALADQPVRLSDLAHQLGIPKSAAHRTLAALLDAGWAEQSQGSECYSLTLQLAILGQRLLAQRSLTDLKQPILDDLANRTRELVRLTAVQNGALVWIGSARGRRAGLVYEPDMGEKILPFATANGKVWLASLPREQAIKIALDSGLGNSRLGGPGRISQLRALEDELDRTAARGFGLAREEAEAGVGAVAVGVTAGEGLYGTMSVAAPIARLSDQRIDELLPLLRKAARNIALAWRGKPDAAADPVKKQKR
jgi:IclR family acetate operon transcriptional repressor